ncbi:MAG: hypothetical protein P1T08_15920 [Acidimicrobiia bacterium]|nr:hypothetical protein [Acidimicrobiia bacterium]
MKKACTLIVTLILVAGCGAATSDGGSTSTSTSAVIGTTTSVVTSTSTVATTSTITSPPPATTSTTVTDSPSIPLDARYDPDATVEFGFLTAVSAGEIVADYAQWLSGDEANQAAFEEGVIASVEEGVPNDYYIRNVNPQLRTLPLADDVTVWLISPVEGVTSVEVGIGEWLGLFNDGVPWDYETDEIPTWDEPYFGYYGAAMKQTPYWFVILDGEVIAIEQQYVP